MQLKTILIFITYQIIHIIILPLVPVYLIIRKIKKKPVFGNFKERIGIIPKNKKQRAVWIHAVSVGEILSIQNLVETIKSKNLCCYVTTGTIAGKKIAQQNLNADYISFLPYDFLIPMISAFKRIKPSSLIVIEAELWPNLIILAKLLGVNTKIINARISKRSEKKYFLFKFIFKNLLNNFDLIMTQSRNDEKTFIKLGLDKYKVRSLGNIKTFNVIAKKEKTKIDNTAKKYPTLLLGSIHPGEIDIYLDLYKKLKKQFKKLKIIIAPRHFFWKKKLIKKIKILNYKFYLWEENKTLNNFEYKKFANLMFDQYDVLLVCKLGELFNLYQASDIFFLGGTFVNIGGHNLLEPSAWSKISIIGPYYDNCKDIYKSLAKSNGIIKVNNFNELYTNTKALLEKQSLINKKGSNAFKWLKGEASFVKNRLNKIINQI